LDGRNIKDIIIVDNRATSFAIHFTNGIPIKDYEGDKNDKWLVALTSYLQSFQGHSDVRTKIKSDFKLEKYVNERGQLRQMLKLNQS
jgi:TFIIF-interacting CTD phosphatase-like protein